MRVAILERTRAKKLSVYLVIQIFRRIRVLPYSYWIYEIIITSHPSTRVGKETEREKENAESHALAAQEGIRA